MEKLPSLKTLITEFKNYGDKPALNEYGNQPVPRSSNWSKFGSEFDIGILDIDNFASLMGFDDYKDLDISITPYDLYARQKVKFRNALMKSSMMAEDMTAQEIDSIMRKIKR
jgi:hypothetical protein